MICTCEDLTVPTGKVGAVEEAVTVVDVDNTVVEPLMTVVRSVRETANVTSEGEGEDVVSVGVGVKTLAKVTVDPAELMVVTCDVVSGSGVGVPTSGVTVTTVNSWMSSEVGVSVGVFVVIKVSEFWLKTVVGGVSVVINESESLLAAVTPPVVVSGLIGVMVVSGVVIVRTSPDFVDSVSGSFSLVIVMKLFVV